jgi:hypothetical protein
MKATSSEKIIAADAPTGIGRMYGPIRPLTNASGISAAMTVKVARIVGLPTSSTARIAASFEREPPPFFLKWRWMFSTTTIVDEMPIGKINAKSVTRLT